MSNIFGTYHINGQPVDISLWRRLGELTVFGGPDRTNLWCNENILFGHKSLCTTLESLHEELPFFCEKCRCAITADARIDNREDLIQALAIDRNSMVPITDSQIIMAAYENWGTSSFSRLIGDFAFVIWDLPKRQMICVRDCIGVKPLYYYLSSKMLAFCSDLKPLVAHPIVNGSPNEGLMGEYLAGHFVSQTETLYREIMRLQPGYYMTVGPDSVRTQCYWKPSFKSRLRYASEADYVEHFQELFSEAVRCRLRSHLPVSAELSGGLDSSSIVGMANSLVHANKANKISVFSLVYSGLGCDERKYIEEVQKYHKIPVNYIEFREHEKQDWCEQIRQTSYLPDPPNLSNSNALLECVRKKGSRVLLTGIGGDELFTGSNFVYLDFLLDHKFGNLLSELKRNHPYMGYKDGFKKLAINLLWPMLPSTIKSAIIRKRRETNIYPPWISSSFAIRNNLAERILQGEAEQHVSNLAHTNLFSNFYTGYESTILESNYRHKAHYQIEVRHPFLDRRIIEFAIAIPNSMHQNEGRQKHLLRLAGKNYIPATIRNRFTKAEFSQLYYQAFNSAPFHNAIQHVNFFPTDFIDREIMMDMYNENMRCFLKNPSGLCRNTLSIWFTFSISLWYHLTTGRKS